MGDAVVISNFLPVSVRGGWRWFVDSRRDHHDCPERVGQGRRPSRRAFVHWSVVAPIAQRNRRATGRIAQMGGVNGALGGNRRRRGCATRR